jgi:hypothetical protein
MKYDKTTVIFNEFARQERSFTRRNCKKILHRSRNEEPKRDAVVNVDTGGRKVFTVHLLTRGKPRTLFAVVGERLRRAKPYRYALKVNEAVAELPAAKVGKSILTYHLWPAEFFCKSFRESPCGSLASQDVIAGANSGGWSGWISLSDINSGGSGAGYGVKISQMTKNGTNPTYAYSDELGWIDFSRSGFQSTLKICEGSFQRALGISPVPLGSGGATTLTTRYGNGTCSTDPLVNANWAKTNTPDNAVVLSALLPSVISNANTVTVTAISVTGIPSKSENITATYLGKTQTAQVAVSCIARTCPGLSAQTDTYCATESQSFDNTCGGTVSCAGTRNCDYNWKEAAP